MWHATRMPTNKVLPIIISELKSTGINILKSNKTMTTCILFFFSIVVGVAAY